MKSNHPTEARHVTSNEAGAPHHGGARPGAGRKSSQNPAKSGSIRLTPERWDKLRALGMDWLGRQIDTAVLQDTEPQDTD